MPRLLGPALIAALLLPACDHGSPNAPSEERAAVVQAPPMVTVPPRPVPTPVPAGPPNQVLKLNPNPPQGVPPFLLAVNMCLSTSDLQGFPLDFSYDFGDGTQKGGRGICRSQHTYSRSGSFKGAFCVTDREPGHQVCQHINVFVN